MILSSGKGGGGSGSEEETSAETSCCCCGIMTSVGAGMTAAKEEIEMRFVVQMELGALTVMLDP